MATVYYERNVVGANLLTQLTTDILSSTDWTRPNAGTFAALFTCTTTRGALMAIDLNTTAVDLNKMSMTAYRIHDGSSGTDPALVYLRHKRTTGGAFATNTYHYILSCGKEHFFLSVEGPRAGETGPDSATLGSVRNYVFLNDIVPYHAGDTIPAVALGGSATNVAPTVAALMHQVRISRNGADNTAWTPATPQTLAPLNIGGVGHWNVQRTATLDANNYYLAPYTLWDLSEGLRGRLASFFYAGSTFVDQLDTPLPNIGQIVTYAGSSYKLLQVNKSDSVEAAWGSFAPVANATATGVNYSPVVAVPYA